jgi:hypothetical protein
MAGEEPTLDEDALDDADEDDEETDQEGTHERPPPEVAPRTLVTSDAALTFPQARTLTTRRGARLVLLMGEIGAGKTTLMVETWTWLVAHGPLANHRFGGSRTAMAFEERAFLSRLEAGTSAPDTLRTHEEDDGLLHLRIARPDGVRVELLLADYSGEHFERIRHGTNLLDELPWATRADRIAVLLDGEGIGRGGGQRELACNHASRQLLALERATSLASTARLAILLVKDDLHDEETLSEAQPRIDQMLQTARELDPDAELLHIAARPADGSNPRGLDAFVEWLAVDDRATSAHAVELPVPSRAIARLNP